MKDLTPEDMTPEMWEQRKRVMEHYGFTEEDNPPLSLCFISLEPLTEAQRERCRQLARELGLEPDYE